MNETMKKKIKELIEKAGYQPLPGFNFANSLQEQFLEKLAVQIVNECVAVCDSVEQDEEMPGLSDGALLCSIEIKERFGMTK